MLGAIIGDIVGSRFEFDRGKKSKYFELFNDDCHFTDDTVMSIAVMEALMNGASFDKYMRKWGQKYPNAGYGGRFYHWLLISRDVKPYYSYGNGSAMRVSSVGWLYDSLEETMEVAKKSAEVTHNHPEGIKGAVATAGCIFLARNGFNKEKIKQFVQEECGYCLDRTLDDIRPSYHHVEDCMHTLPEAITAFLEADGFEDAIRNAVSLGGDTDTLAAITGSIAEAYYGIDDAMRMKALTYLPDDMKEALDLFDCYLLEKVIHNALSKTNDADDYVNILSVLHRLLKCNVKVKMPITDYYDCKDEYSMVYVEDGDWLPAYFTSRTGKERYIPLFTHLSELHFSECVTDMYFKDVLIAASKCDGLLIHPYHEPFIVPKNILNLLLKSL